MPISRSNRPTLAITMGDPSGIGPEVTLKALASPVVRRLADFFVIGDRYVMDKVRRTQPLRRDVKIIDMANVPRKDFCWGRSRPVFGHASLEYIDKAVELVKGGKASALVTAPVNKASINAFLLKTYNLKLTTAFQGHTEYLAEKTGSRHFAMMFVGPKLKLTLVTRHLALKDVSKHLSAESIYKTVVLTHGALRKFFRIKNPRLAVAGLNPHAGESGLMGNEERDIIIPAINRASKYIRNIVGPMPPDVIFYDLLNKKFDAAVCMYHDQALIPFKMLYFKNGVNLTLGLPFIRTSPDHGTAFDIAGKGRADPASMIEAIKLAASLSAR